jgi:hypothetical protein
MDYCGPLGIPHSRFLTWSEDDQQKALWWKARQRQTCPNCSTHPDDWNEDLDGRRDAYTGEIQTCPGCRERQRVEADLERDRRDTPHAHYGARVVLVRPETQGE